MEGYCFRGKKIYVCIHVSQKTLTLVPSSESIENIMALGSGPTLAFFDKQPSTLTTLLLMFSN